MTDAHVPRSITNEPNQAGLSLDQLSAGLQSLLQSGDDPYQVLPDESADPILTAANTTVESSDPVVSSFAGNCELKPLTIVEAMLFVGTPDHRPLTSSELAAPMRGVTAAEVDEFVVELNAKYRAARCPYTIASVGAGYRMELLPEFTSLRQTMFGGVREVRLSPAAIDVLSIVAYHQPATTEQIETLRGTPSGTILGQLVRRQLLQLERESTKPRTVRYSTTERFLQLFGLASLAELPQGLELEK